MITEHDKYSGDFGVMLGFDEGVSEAFQRVYNMQGEIKKISMNDAEAAAQRRKDLQTLNGLTDEQIQLIVRLNNAYGDMTDEERKTFVEMEKSGNALIRKTEAEGVTIISYQRRIDAGKEGNKVLENENDLLKENIDLLNIANSNIDTSSMNNMITDSGTNDTISPLNINMGGEFEGLNNLLQSFNEELFNTQNLAYMVGDAFNIAFGTISNSIAQGKADWASFGIAVIDVLNQVISMMLVKAVASLMSEEAKKGIPGIITGLVGAGILLAVMKGKMQQGKATDFADGGIVYGETFARVGEYSGARNNPEVIAPLSDLSGILQKSNIGGGSYDTIYTRIGFDYLEMAMKKIDRKNKSKYGL